METNKYDVIVIGAGLGGLECAYILQKHGKRVLVLEAGALLGGCLQTFRREGHTFDTGFHYVGGLEEGQMLWKLFSYFNLMNLPWVKMNEDCFDEVVLGNESFSFANGYDHFVDTLSQQFPAQHNNLKNYTALLKNVGDNIVHSFDPRSAADVYQTSLFAKSAFDFITSTISDPKLIDVLSGTSLKMELCQAKLPLYNFAQINSSFIQSAYRIRGGGGQIAEALRQSIENMGGTVLRNKKVTAFEGNNGQATAVTVNNGQERFEADIFISDIHPAPTVSLLHDAGLVRKVYQKRISQLENTFGMLTVNILLKPNLIKYQNKNIYIYKQPNVWRLHENLSSDVNALMVSFPPPEDNSTFSTVIDLLTPMNWSTVQQWFGTKIGHRGNDYDELKHRFAEKCIDLASERIPGLRDAIANYWVSTPLTYADYTGTEQGSAYGIRKDFNATMYTVLTPKTPVPNVFLTGQNLNLHGILGTSMTSVFTCAEIIGMQSITNDLNNF